MELKNEERPKKTATIYVRMAPVIVNRVRDLAAQAGVGTSTIIRRIVEHALEEGVTVEQSGKRRPRPRREI